MAWLYLPDTVVLKSESTQPLEEYEPWVTLSGKATQRPLSWRGWKSRPWIKLLSGMTLPPSTADRGAELWISSLRDSLASPSAPQDRGRERPTSDGCGTTSSESFARFNPAGSLVRTSQDLFGSDSKLYSDRLPRWGMMLAGELFEQSRWEPHISVSESSSSPSDGTAWAGVTAHERTHSPRQVHPKKGGTQLANQVAAWATPCSHNARHMNTKYAQGGTPLTMQGVNWPTPAARDEKGANAPPHKRKNATGRQQMGQLPNFVAHSLPPVPQNSECGPECSPSHRRLNPAFVEWLMGLPKGWTTARIGSGPVATEWSRYKQQLQYALSQIAQGGS